MYDSPSMRLMQILAIYVKSQRFAFLKRMGGLLMPLDASRLS
jgi:hypothetical protein